MLERGLSDEYGWEYSHEQPDPNLEKLGDNQPIDPVLFINT